MKIAIIGSGGVGGYFGAKLAQAGFNVTFLARGAHLNEINKNGLTVKSILGDFKVKNLAATDKIEKIPKADLIIVAVKAWQIKEIREDLLNIIHENSLILPLQNGVLASEELIEKIDTKHILGGLCRIISKVESPGIINHLGVSPSIIFGELNHTETDRLKAVLSVFKLAGIEAKIAENIQAEIWKKFIAICVSGLLAVSNTSYGEIRELKETREMMLQLMNEIYSLSQKMGIQIEAGFVEKTLSFIDTFPYDSTSSLTRDVWEGKPSEIEYQNGTVVKLGEKYKVPTPINKFIYYSIKPREQKARKVQV